MRERLNQKAAIGLGLILATTTSAIACDYHWAIGIPEPEGI